jgi:hypothetical protein
MRNKRYPPGKSDVRPKGNPTIASVGACRAEVHRVKAGCARELRLGRPKNIENNPMQSNMASLAWML